MMKIYAGATGLNDVPAAGDSFLLDGYPQHITSIVNERCFSYRSNRERYRTDGYLYATIIVATYTHTQQNPLFDASAQLVIEPTYRDLRFTGAANAEYAVVVVYAYPRINEPDCLFRGNYDDCVVFAKQAVGDCRFKDYEHTEDAPSV